MKTIKRIRLKFLKKYGKCYYCNMPFMGVRGKKEATIDHVIPLGKGGLNKESNMVLACKKCNQQKADKLIV